MGKKKKVCVGPVTADEGGAQSRTVCLTWTVVRILANHDNSNFTQRGIV
jgi:hypothetical protein